MTGAKTTRRRAAPPSQAAEKEAGAELEKSDVKSPFQFELYTGRTSQVGKAFLTIEATGRISISTGAGRIFGIPEAVLLLFDRQKKVLAIRSAGLGADHSLKVVSRIPTPGAKSCGFAVSAIGFCHRYQLTTSSSQRYPAEMYDGMLIADLNKPLA